MNHISLCLFTAIQFVYFVLCHLGWGRVWTWVNDPPMIFTILSGRWVGNTGCPEKSSSKGGHPTSVSCQSLKSGELFLQAICISSREDFTEVKEVWRWNSHTLRKLALHGNFMEEKQQASVVSYLFTLATSPLNLHYVALVALPPQKFARLPCWCYCW
jgi:hypothetical protein